MYLKDKKHVIALRLDDETYNFFVECALVHDCSLSEILRSFLESVAMEGGAYDKSTNLDN